jgi:hypothetical protein
MSELNLQKVEAAPIVPFRPGEIQEGIQGDLNPEDRNITRLKQIQNVGDASMAWPNNRGDFLLNNILCPKPIELSFFGSAGYYVQNIPFGSEQRPITFPSAQEVMANGGNLKQYVKAGQDDMNFVPASDLFVILSYPAPKAAAPVAATNGKAKAARPGKKAAAPAAATNGKNWFSDLPNALPFENLILILAVWTARGTAYRALLPRLRSEQARLARENQPLVSARFTLEGANQKIGVNNIWVPILTLQPTVNSPAFVEFVRASIKGK